MPRHRDYFCDGPHPCWSSTRTTYYYEEERRHSRSQSSAHRGRRHHRASSPNIVEFHHVVLLDARDSRSGTRDQHRQRDRRSHELSRSSPPPAVGASAEYYDATTRISSLSATNSPLAEAQKEIEAPISEAIVRDDADVPPPDAATESREKAEPQYERRAGRRVYVSGHLTVEEQPDDGPSRTETARGGDRARPRVDRKGAPAKGGFAQRLMKRVGYVPIEK